jgi:taurine dioxygenase
MAAGEEGEDMAIAIHPMAAGVGATVTGFDRERVSPAEADALYRAFIDHGMLVFTGLDLDARTHMALARLFGEPEDPHPVAELRHKDEPNLRILAANGGQPVAADDPDADRIIGQIPWHADRAYTEYPARGALLRAIVIPAEGGRTGWIDTARAYRLLPRELKRRIQGLRIVHSYETSHSKQSMVGGRGDILPESSHPLVWVHPENDLPVLALSPATAKEIVGLPRAEGDALLEELIAHVTREETAYVHDWAPGDVVAWDNWRMIHRAYGHAKRYPRVMNSLQLKGPMRLGRIVTQRAAEAA